jgi:large subunit ribosomal protein L22
MRLIADLIRGKKVAEARDILRFTVKGGSPLLSKLLASAVANAESEASKTRTRINTDEYVVTKLLVDKGMTIHRYQPMTRGRGGKIRKRTHHIVLTISGD